MPSATTFPRRLAEATGALLDEVGLTDEALRAVVPEPTDPLSMLRNRLVSQALGDVYGDWAALAERELKLLTQFDDPASVYVLCGVCTTTSPVFASGLR